MRCIERQWIREAMIRQSLVMRGGDTPMKSKAAAMLGKARHRRSMEPKGRATQRLGQASQRTAAERQRKDVTCKGDEWPGNAAEEQGEETE